MISNGYIRMSFLFYEDFMILGVTGHRKIYLNDRKKIQLARIILDLAPEKVITGMALGFDIDVAHVCVNYNIPFIAAIPCDNQSARWSENQKWVYRELLKKALDVTQVCAGDYAAWKMFKRDEWIVNNSDKLLAFYDGRENGGTYHTITYATGKIEVVNIYEQLQNQMP